MIDVLSCFSPRLVGGDPAEEDISKLELELAQNFQSFLKGKLVSEVDSENVRRGIYEKPYLSNTKNKGLKGRVVEMALTGKTASNLSEADFKSTLEIKTMCQKNQKFKEHLRVTALNYNEIKTTKYERSSLYLKGILFIIVIDSCSEKIERGIILDIRKLKQTREFYEKVVSLCKMGKAHELNSRARDGELLMTYSHGNGQNIKTYEDLSKMERKAKGKAFYLNKNELARLLTNSSNQLDSSSVVKVF